MIIHWQLISILKGRSVSMFLVVFLATIISKSISVSSTSDLNLSDNNYRHIHKHQLDSYPSGGPTSRAKFQWVYSGNDNNNRLNVGSDEQPSALTQIDRFFSTGRFSDSTGISGHFPFDYHQKGRHSRRHSLEQPMLSIPSIPDIPPVPAMPERIHLSYPSSAYFLEKDRDMIYRNENNYKKNNYEMNGKNRNNDYNHGIRDYTTHDNSHHNHNYQRWHYTHNSGHSFHSSYDSGPPNHDSAPNTFWIKTYTPNISTDFSQSYNKPFQRPMTRSRTRREHLSRRTSYAKDRNRVHPEIDDKLVKNNAFYKELEFSWNVEQGY